MKRLVFLVPLAVLLATSLSCSQLAVAAATVNGDKISEATVERELDRVRSDPTFQDLLRRQADQVLGFARRQILSGLIRQQILEQQARRLRVVVTGAQADRLLSDEATRTGTSVKQFLKSQKLSLRDGHELAVRVVREFELKSIVIQETGVSAAEIQSFYDRNRSAFEQVHLARITTKTQADARAALEQVASGRDFADVAKARSTDAAASKGGDLGFVAMTTLPGDVQAALTQVQGAGLTTPLQTAGGFQVYRVIERRTQPLTDVASRIRSQLAGQSLDTRFEDWVRGYLASARVVVNPEYGRFDRQALAVVPGTGAIRR
jgi:parvulin-like peptidyl-prolyl isomerase